MTYATRERNLVHQTAMQKLLYAAFPGTIDREVHIDYACEKLGGAKHLVDKSFGRVDFVIYSVGAGKVKGVVIVECDEDEHGMYSQLCESTRMFNVTQSIRESGVSVPIAWIRFNPDEFQINGIIHNPSAEKREAVLIDTIRGINFDDGISERIRYLFYSKSSFNKFGELMPTPVLDEQFQDAVRSWVMPGTTFVDEGEEEYSDDDDPDAE